MAGFLFSISSPSDSRENPKNKFLICSTNLSQCGKLTPSARELNQLINHSLESSVSFISSIAFLLLLIAACSIWKYYKLVTKGPKKNIICSCCDLNATDPVTHKTCKRKPIARTKVFRCSRAGWCKTCPKSSLLLLLQAFDMWHCNSQIYFCNKFRNRTALRWQNLRSFNLQR